MIKFTFDKHAYAFPSKVLAGNGGEHILNIIVEEDTDNGKICGIGDWQSFDTYKEAAVPASYKAKIVEQAADGNWYVQVTEVDPKDKAVFICEVPEIKENYDTRFTDPKNFYNPAGKAVRGYVLAPYDIYELSEEGFDGTPEAGKEVTIVGGKHKVA